MERTQKDYDMNRESTKGQKPTQSDGKGIALLPYHLGHLLPYNPKYDRTWGKPRRESKPAYIIKQADGSLAVVFEETIWG